MQQPKVDDRVLLRQDIPELSLKRGCLGVVRSTWCEPWLAYEVEFETQDDVRRTLLLASQVQCLCVDADDRDDEPTLAGYGMLSVF